MHDRRLYVLDSTCLAWLTGSAPSFSINTSTITLTPPRLTFFFTECGMRLVKRFQNSNMKILELGSGASIAFRCAFDFIPRCTHRKISRWSAHLSHQASTTICPARKNPSRLQHTGKNASSWGMDCSSPGPLHSLDCWCLKPDGSRFRQVFSASHLRCSLSSRR